MELSKKLVRRAAAGTLFAGVITAAAFAAEAPAPAKAPADAAPPADTSQPCGRNRTMDLNKMKERGVAIFAQFDSNGDGKITEVEFLAAEPRGHGMKQGMGGGMGPGMGPGPGMGGDRGRLGTPWTAEAQQAFNTELFKALDTDGNGQLSPAEFAKAHETMHTMMKKSMFTRLDTNKDGVLTKDEFPAFTKRMAALDTNGDGQVTPEEMRAAKQAKQTAPGAPTPPTITQPN